MRNVLRDWLLAGSGQGVLPLTLDATTVEFTADETSGQDGISLLITPTVLYENGRTHFVFQEPGVGLGKINIITYDDRYGLSRRIGIHRRTGPSYDVHHRPAIVLRNGRLYIIIEKDHNGGFMSVLKNRTAGDYNIFELTATEIGVVGNYPTYPKLHEKNGIEINLTQYDDSFAGFNKNSSGDFEGIWSDVTSIAAKAIDEDEHYPNSVLNSDVVTDELVYCIQGRNDDTAVPTWFNGYLIRQVTTAGGVTYYNWNKSFSKTSVLTSAELIANCRYFTTGSDIIDGYPPMSALDAAGNFYDVRGDGAGGYDLIYQMVGDSSPTRKGITLPGAPVLVTASEVSAS